MSLELAKFEALLQKPAAIKKFRTLYDQCNLLTRTRTTPVTEGELMTVCAYLAGREYAGSAATKEACARLGCITTKTFNKVQDTVGNLLQKRQKHGFTAEELQITLALESMLKMDIAQDLKDERIVCGLFAVVCQLFGYKSSQWIKEETELYELDPLEVAVAIERVSTVHGERVKTFVLSARNPGRSSRQSQPARRKQPPLPRAVDLGAPALKRKASGEAMQKQGPVKRAKTQASSTASVPSTRYSGSSEVTGQSPPATEPSTGDWMSTLDGADDPMGQDVSREVSEKESIGSTQSESEEHFSENDNAIDWESVSRRRQRAIIQQQKRSSSGIIAVSKPVFVDRGFWQSTWP